MSKKDWLQNLFKELTGVALGEAFWLCHLECRDLQTLINNVDLFWKGVLVSWFSINWTEPIESEQVKNEVIWYNSSIKVNRQTVFYKELYCKGVCKIRDLLDENECFLSYDTVVERFGIPNVMRVNSIILAIPETWKRLLCEGTTREPENRYESWKKLNKTAGVLYKVLNGEKLLFKTHADRWSISFASALDVDTFLKKIERIYTFTNSTKLRSFQYRLLLHGIITNIYLKYYGLQEDDMCTFCKGRRETIAHLFFECSKVAPLWDYIVKLCTKELTVPQIICNEVVSNSKRVENVIVLIAKQYVYRTRCLNENLSVQALIGAIKMYKEIEGEVAKNNGRISHHTSKWANVEIRNM